MQTELVPVNLDPQNMGGGLPLVTPHVAAGGFTCSGPYLDALGIDPWFAVATKARWYRNLPPRMLQACLNSRRWNKLRAIEYMAGDTVAQGLYDEEARELHPDTRQPMTEAELLKACGADEYPSQAPEPVAEYKGKLPDPATWMPAGAKTEVATMPATPAGPTDEAAIRAVITRYGIDEACSRLGWDRKDARREREAGITDDLVDVVRLIHRMGYTLETWRQYDGLSEPEQALWKRLQSEQANAPASV